MLRGLRSGLTILAATALVACSERGALDFTPEGTVEESGADIVQLVVATNRAPGDVRTGYSSARSGQTAYSEYQVSVPPGHEPGQIEWPGSAAPDPREHFVTSDIVKIDSDAALVSHINRRLRELPASQRRVVVFAHGYNNNFAESLYRTTQIQHDISNKGLPVLYAWPSAASGFGYLYDRDSVLYTRSEYARFLELLTRTNAREIIVTAHSMGSLLTMEALVEIVGKRGREGLSRFDAVALLSPDIDIDVFQQQAEKISPLPQPFLVFTSSRDKALRLSAKLSADQRRLGSIQDASEFDKFDITFIDTTAFAEKGDLNHLTAVTSPEVLAFLDEIGSIGSILDSDVAVNSGIMATTVDHFQNATEVVLTAR